MLVAERSDCCDLNRKGTLSEAPGITVVPSFLSECRTDETCAPSSELSSLGRDGFVLLWGGLRGRTKSASQLSITDSQPSTLWTAVCLKSAVLFLVLRIRGGAVLSRLPARLFADSG